MKGGGAFLIIVVALLLLAAVLYGKTGCFGGFWNCAFGSMQASSGGLAPVHNVQSNSVLGTHASATYSG
jgi:hypothetical protein